jgi:hypothetical protein
MLVEPMTGFCEGAGVDPGNGLRDGDDVDPWNGFIEGVEVEMEVVGVFIVGLVGLYVRGVALVGFTVIVVGTITPDGDFVCWGTAVDGVTETAGLDVLGWPGVPPAG